jgi:TP901 family phage tail tape measure protein
VSDYNLGTARGVIQIDYNGSGATQATRDMRGAGSAADDASKRMSKAGTHLRGGGLAIAAGLGLAVKSAADFEKQLSNVAAVSGATDSEMEGLRNKALQLGKDTQFSASESAQAIEELVKAGLSVQDVMNGAADATVNLAAAGGVSMPEAATIASNAMNQFGLAAGDMVGVADNIAGAANASAIDVSDFGQSLSQVGAVANLAGAKFEDTATAIALMGNAGIKGSDAGTSLKSMLMNLQPQTDKQKALFEDLGLAVGKSGNAFYDAEGNLKSMDKVAGALGDSLEGMGAKQKQAALEVLFGSDGIRAAAILAKNGSKGFDKMAKSMGKVSAADVAAKKMDNFAGSVEQLKGSLETLMIQFGTPLLGGLRAIVDGFTKVLNVLLSLPGPVLEAGTAFLAIMAGLLLAVGAVLKLKAALMALRAGALLISGPLVLIIAAVAALVAAFLYFYKTNEKFRAFVQTMGEAIKKYLIGLIQKAIPYLQRFGDFIKKVFQASLPYIKQFGGFLQDTFQKVLPYIQKVGAFVERFQKQFKIAGAVLLVLFIPTVLGVIAIIAALVAAFMHFYNSSAKFRSVVQGIGAFLKELGAIFMDKVLPVLIEVAKMIGGALVDAFHKIMPEIQKMVPVVMDLWDSLVGLFNAIIGSPAFKFLITVLGILAKLFVSTILPLLLRVGGIFTKVFVEILGTAIKTALGIIRGVLNIIIGIIKVFTGLLTGHWSKAWEGVKQILKGVVGIIGSILKGLLSTAGSIIKGLGALLLAGIKAIPGLLKGAGSLFVAAGKFLIQAFVDGMKNAAGLIEGIACNVWNFVRGLLNGAIAHINAALEFTVNPPGPGSVTINPPDIPALSKGGVLTAPTMAWVAEAGQDEAVIPLKKLWNEIDRVYKAGRTVNEDPEARSAGRGGSPGTMAGPSRSRLVEGRLYIDKSGKAYIKGIAEDVVEGNDRFATTHGRMG